MSKQLQMIKTTEVAAVIEPARVAPDLVYSGDDPVEQRRYFLGALAETGQVSVACSAVGVSRIEAHQWRKDPVFERAWQDAYKIARSVIVDEAVSRAVHGAHRPIFNRDGEVTGWLRVPSDAVLTVILKEPHLLG